MTRWSKNLFCHLQTLGQNPVGSESVQLRVLSPFPSLKSKVRQVKSTFKGPPSFQNTRGVSVAFRMCQAVPKTARLPLTRRRPLMGFSAFESARDAGLRGSTWWRPNGCRFPGPSPKHWWQEPPRLNSNQTWQTWRTLLGLRVICPWDVEKAACYLWFPECNGWSLSSLRVIGRHDALK